MTQFPVPQELPREVFCVVCSNVMYSPEHTPMQIRPCGHVVCENCLRKLNLNYCPICSHEIMSYQADKKLFKRYKAILQNKPIPNPDDVCNYIKFSTNLIKQRMYQCMTCQSDNDQYLCENCARFCHNGHILLKYENVICSGCNCGQNHLRSACRCLCPDHNKLICTLSLKPVVQLQHCLSCKTCDLQYVCNACAEKCHRGHNLVDAGLCEQVCQCGLGKGLCECRCYSPESVANMVTILPTMPPEERIPL